jgi:PAS domain S-box-containing protein
MEVLPPDVGRLCMKNLRKALKTNEIQTYNYSLPYPENPSELNYFEARVVAYDSHEALALIRDITQQKKAELSLKASEERWKSLVNSAPQYILTIDKHDRITFINYLKEMKPDQIVGKTIHEIFMKSPFTREQLTRMLSAARAGNKKSVEIPLKMRNEIIWLNVKGAPVISGTGEPELIVMALDITERKKAEDELRQSHEKLKALYQRLESIREEEKKNIALEIHDELGQELTAIKLGIFWLQQYFDRETKTRDFKEVQHKVKSLIELSTQTITSARRLAHQLRPIVLDNLGLIPAIEWQIEKLNEVGKLKCTFNTNITGEKFSQGFSIALFRIIQESLTNIVRHAGATQAHVDLHIHKKSLTLAVEDNGIGIKSDDFGKPDKIGIFGMRERVQAWNGEMDIAGYPGKGTRLKISFPLKNVRK